jgi:hypothetical protein
MKSFARIIIALLLATLTAHAEPPPQATYSCGLSNNAGGALETAAQGDNKLSLTIGDGIFRLNGGELNVMGQITSTGSGDESVTGSAGNYFAEVEVHTLTAANGEHAGRAAFARDSKGVAVALVQLTDGQYFMGCFDNTATAADFSDQSPPPKTQQPVAETPEAQPEPELTDEQKLEKLFAEAPKQRGKENEIFGPVSITKPDEGHYNCSSSSYYSDGEVKTNNQIDSDDDHTGFDLFADGSYRLKKTDGTFEDAGASWRHNPANGVVLFDQGTLSVYLKWPIHVRKKLDGQATEVSLLYITDYDYDGPLDDMTVCANSGPTQSKSPNAEIAARAEKNLNPPAPGSERISGLYYHQQWQTMFGPNFTTYQVDYYSYRYFQDNGYVWLSDPPADGDFEKLGCNKPMVDTNGEPDCTTYAIEDGLFSQPTIRIGHDEPVPFEQSDGAVSVDGTQFLLMKYLEDLKLDIFVRYFSYTGILMREGSFTFRQDGTFETSSASGISYTQEIPDVSRTTVTSYDPGKDLKGRYEINGYSLTLTNENGGISKKFFGYMSDGFFMIGGQPYFKPSD